MIEKKKRKLKSLIRFHSANKTDNYNRAGGGGREKNRKKKKTSKRIYRNKKVRLVNAFFESLLPEYFPSLGVKVPLTSLGCLPTLCYLWTCYWNSSDSNLVLLLCVLASNVHSYQN